MAGVDYHLKRVIRALSLIELRQFLSQAVGLHPHDRIPLRIELGWFAQRLDCDVVLFEARCLAVEILPNDVVRDSEFSAMNWACMSVGKPGYSVVRNDCAFRRPCV